MRPVGNLKYRYIVLSVVWRIQVDVYAFALAFTFLVMVPKLVLDAFNQSEQTGWIFLTNQKQI